jgi:hypothetical protein
MEEPKFRNLTDSEMDVILPNLQVLLLLLLRTSVFWSSVSKSSKRLFPLLERESTTDLLLRWLMKVSGTEIARRLLLSFLWMTTLLLPSMLVLLGTQADSEEVCF